MRLVVYIAVFLVPATDSIEKKKCYCSKFSVFIPMLGHLDTRLYGKLKVPVRSVVVGEQTEGKNPKTCYSPPRGKSFLC